MLFSTKRVSILTYNMTQPLEGPRRPGEEPNAGLVLLTDRQRAFAELMISDPPAAFSLIKRKYDALPATETLGVKTSRIGETPIEVKFDGTLDFEKLTLTIPMAGVGMATLFLNSWEQGNGLEQEFVDNLKGGLTEDANFGVEIEVSARYGFAYARAIGWDHRDGYRQLYVLDSVATKSRLVIAQLFDLLEPQGIESADEAEAADGLIPPQGDRKIQSVVEGPAPAAKDTTSWVSDVLLSAERSSGSPVNTISASAVPQTGEKAQAGPVDEKKAAARGLAELMRTDPAGAFAQMRETFAEAGGGSGRANIGSTQVKIGMDGMTLTLSLEIDYRNLQHFMENCGENASTKAFKTALDSGISGSHRLQMRAELIDSGARIVATSTRWDGSGQVPDKKGVVSPQVFAELVGMLKPFVRSQRYKLSYVDVRPAGSSSRDRENKEKSQRRGRKIRGTSSY